MYFYYNAIQTTKIYIPLAFATITRPVKQETISRYLMNCILIPNIVVFLFPFRRSYTRKEIL